MAFGIELQLCAKNENSSDEHDINQKVPNSLSLCRVFFLSVTESWLIWDQSFSLTFNFNVLIIAFQKYEYTCKLNIPECYLTENKTR